MAWATLYAFKLPTIAHAKSLYQTAKAKGTECPFVVHVAVEDELPFVAGW